MSETTSTRATEPLKRSEAIRFLYGGESLLRYTQDTPVLPDVWIEYLLHPRSRCSLLVSLLEEESGKRPLPGDLCLLLDTGIKQFRKKGWKRPWRSEMRSPELVYNRTSVNGLLWFDELVRVVLPLTGWWAERSASQPSDWPLRNLDATSPDGAANQATVNEALQLLDRHVREAHRDSSLASAQGRAEIVFPQVAADRETSRTPVDEATYQQRFHEAQNGAPRAAASSPTEPWSQRLTRDPDVLWTIRLIGTVACLADGAPGFVAELRELYPPPNHIGPLDPPAGTENDPEAERKRRTDLANNHYRRVVRAAAEVLGDVSLWMSGPESAARKTARPLAPARVHSVSRCRRASLLIARSRSTVKADAAVQLFNVNCRDITWAVVDCGIDATHPAFLSRETLFSRVLATYDFSYFRELLRDAAKSPAERGTPPPHLRKLYDQLGAGGELSALARDLRTSLISGRELDWRLLLPFITVNHTPAEYRPPLLEHGTHVAGIIGADCPNTDGAGGASAARGMCPEIRIFDFRVLNDDGEGDEFNVMAALQFIRYLNAHQDVPVIHGVNLSLSIPHDVSNYACGRTPICQECERLVNAGVVVVAAAGNEGYIEFMTGRGPRENYHAVSITDPGNAEGVITVGATHRFQPHNYGVSYFSSRGPTGDGRAKPDLVAPGEKITSTVPGGGYKPLDGTSMAAPHVSGAAALLMARHRELVGQPGRIKEILRATATDLGREPYYQGSGMLDVLRALSSI